MNPSDKDLAEFLRELLKLEHCKASGFLGGWTLRKGYTVHITLRDAFDPQDNDALMLSCLIRHLIEDEMRKRIGHLSVSYVDEDDSDVGPIACWLKTADGNYEIGDGETPTRAVALAAYRALDGKI